MVTPQSSAPQATAVQAGVGTGPLQRLCMCVSVSVCARQCVQGIGLGSPEVLGSPVAASRLTVTRPLVAATPSHVASLGQ